MYGLYDTDGILRFIGGDREACVAYAELFDLHSVDCSLMALPEPNAMKIRVQRRGRRRVMSNS